MSSPNNLKARAFLAAFRITASITRAAEAAGIARDLHYRWLKDSKGYAAAFAEARIQAGQYLEDVAVERADRGDFEPLVYKGQFCYAESEYEEDAEASEGKRRKVYRLKADAKPLGVWKKSDQLLIVLLKGAMPDKYRERGAVELSGPGGNAINVNVSGLDLLKSRIDSLAQRRGT